jgi:hypothetical protein
MAFVAVEELVNTPLIPRVVIPLKAPVVETSKAELSIEKVPAPENAIVPVEANPVNPDPAPAAVISQTFESMVTLAVLFPKVVTPVEDNAVKAPDPWVVTPIVVKFPAAGVVDPMAPGMAQVPPSSWLTLMTPDVTVPPV